MHTHICMYIFIHTRIQYANEIAHIKCSSDFNSKEKALHSRNIFVRVNSMFDLF